MEKEKHLPLFVVIPSNVHFAKDLSDKDVRIYGYISALANAKGYCYATNKYLAETFNVSESTIKRAISSLVKKNYLKSVIITDSEGMIIERRLFIVLPEINQNPDKPHNDGRVKNELGGGFKFDLYNNINNNNNYGAVETDTEHSKVKTSSEKSDDESKQTKQKKSKKDKVRVVKEDTTYFRIMEHFNSKDNTKFKANTKEYIENIDALLITYTEEEIKGVIDYVKECNYNEKYWRPTTIFRPSNFERTYEFYLKWDKKKTCENTQAPSQQQLFYFVNKNVGKVIASPVRPNLPNHLIFSNREEAEATL